MAQQVPVTYRCNFDDVPGHNRALQSANVTYNRVRSKQHRASAVVVQQYGILAAQLPCLVVCSLLTLQVYYYLFCPPTRFSPT